MRKLKASDFVDFETRDLSGYKIITRRQQMREMRKDLQLSLQRAIAEHRSLTERQKNLHFQLMDLEALMRDEGMLRVQAKRRRR